MKDPGHKKPARASAEERGLSAPKHALNGPIDQTAPLRSADEARPGFAFSWWWPFCRRAEPTERPTPAVPSRTLIYGMQSSGASLFACLLAQAPNTAAIIDLYSKCVAPAIRIDVPLVVKATVSCYVRYEEHAASLNPVLQVLFLRNPFDVYASLMGKYYRNAGGPIPQKFLELERIFEAQQEFFDLVVLYERLILEPASVIEALTQHGFPLPANALSFPRSLKDIGRHTRRHCTWCRKQFRRRWGYGNVHVPAWGTLERLPYGELDSSAADQVRRWCPSLVAFYEQQQLSRPSEIRGSHEERSCR
jgi:hypothetical protein